MGLFSKNNNMQALTQRQQLEGRYNSARGNILLVVGLTVINIILLVTNSNTYFLFSAYFPFLLADFGMLLCGMYPSEVYEGELAGMQFLGKGFLVATLALAAVILGLYLLSWYLSKKPRIGWLIFALVFFCVDTLAMFFIGGFSVESIIDYVIHAWVIVSLAMGVSAYFRLKAIPEDSDEEEAPITDDVESYEVYTEPEVTVSEPQAEENAAEEEKPEPQE